MKRSWVRLIAIALPGCVAIACLNFCVGGPHYYSSKYRRPEQPSALVLPRLALVPEQQIEPHTCGLHAISSIYRAYGLDPVERNLRFRLGTDQVLSNFDDESVGTIHPDMVRVVAQDGFDIRHCLNRGSELNDHLAAGHPALALIREKGLHWVAIDSLTDGQFTICDSLHEAEYVEPSEPFARDRILSLLLVSPRQP